MRFKISTELEVVSDEVAVSAQISIEDVATIHALGYKSIVCNRPDGESPDQVNFNEIESAALNLGLMSVYQPVISGEITNEDVAKFKKIMEELPLPICAYCRSGARCTNLWSLAIADHNT